MRHVKVGIAGATGYLGAELVRILASHPRVEISALGSSTKGGIPLSRELPHLKGVVDQSLVALDAADPGRTFRGCDVVFLAMPHGKALEMAPKLLASDATQVVIDLSGDHRLADPALAKAIYGAAAAVPALYALPEATPHEAIRKANLLANPGCYPTAGALAALPLVEAGLVKPDVIVDAKSGVTGAGREPSSVHHFPEGNERVVAYKVGEHRHEPEIAQTLSGAARAPVAVTFTPHLVPMNRGILATVYLDSIGAPLSPTEAREAYAKRYASSPWVRIRDDQPDTKHVRLTNFADVAIAPLPGKRRYVATCAIDNLVKGGSGQAIQNMNIRFGFSETEGLPATGGGV